MVSRSRSGMSAIRVDAFGLALMALGLLGGLLRGRTARLRLLLGAQRALAQLLGLALVGLGSGGGLLGRPVLAACHLLQALALGAAGAGLDPTLLLLARAAAPCGAQRQHD